MKFVRNQKHCIMKKIISTLFAIVLLCTLGIAQSGISIVNDESVSSNQNLRKIFDMQVDNDGNLWVAYPVGVAKFTGEEVTLFNMENSNLPDSIVLDLELSDNLLYAATVNGVAFCNLDNPDYAWYIIESFQDMCVSHIAIDAERNNLYALASDEYFINNISTNSNQGGMYNIRDFISYNLDDASIKSIPYYGATYYPSNSNISMNIVENGDVYFINSNKMGYKTYPVDGDTIQEVAYTRVYSTINYNNGIIIKSGDGVKLLDTESHQLTDYDLGLSHPECQDITVKDKFFKISDSEMYICGNDLNNPHSFGSEEGSYENSISIWEIDLNQGINSRYIIPPASILTSTTDNSITLIGSDPLSYKLESFGDNIFIAAYYGIYKIDKSEYNGSNCGYTMENMKIFDGNSVVALVKGYGTLFQGNYEAYYSVPKDSLTNTIFSTALWIGGFDENDDLHFSGEKHNQDVEHGLLNKFDFFPGPLTNGSNGMYATCDPNTASDYNKVWKIDKLDIERYLYSYNNGNPLWITSDVATWPGNGPEGFDENIAPFIDNDGDNIYNPQNGDYPEIKGDQMLWWVVNDITSPHNSTDGEPLGVEIQYSLYGYVYDNPPDEFTDLINYQTFLNAKIINRSQNTYDSVYIGLFVDGDLGCPVDDYIGCDVERNSFYFYNGDNVDENYQGINGFGENPPLQTVTILNSPIEGDQLLSKFIYFNNSGTGANPNTLDPETSVEYYNYLAGHWLDNTPICYGGTGHYSGGANTEIPCDFMFPGNTDSEYIGTNGVFVDEWSEETEDNPPADRRGLGSIGPITLEPGEEVEIEILFGFIPSNQSKEKGIFDYTQKLDSLINWFNTETIPSNYEALEYANTDDVKFDNLIDIFPNPVDNYFNLYSKQKIEKINIYSISGQKIITKHINNRSANIDVSNLESGIYILEAYTNNNKKEFKKIIIR